MTQKDNFVYDNKITNNLEGNTCVGKKMQTQGVCLGNERAYLVSKPLPALEAGFVLIEPQYSGICGSDLHAFYQPETPGNTIRGHELTAVVAEVGGANSHIKVGQKVMSAVFPSYLEQVVLEPIARCGSCKYCLAQKYNLCTKLNIIGVC
jgi:threonine dehydrogenase-like Zn-dependent dehydrogenase